jgi:hypothetical protein
MHRETTSFQKNIIKELEGFGYQLENKTAKLAYNPLF